MWRILRARSLARPEVSNFGMIDEIVTVKVSSRGSGGASSRSALSFQSMRSMHASKDDNNTGQWKRMTVIERMRSLKQGLSEAVSGNVSHEKSDEAIDRLLDKETKNDDDDYVDMFNPANGEWNGPRHGEPTRYGDWAHKGRATDFV